MEKEITERKTNQAKNKAAPTLLPDGKYSSEAGKPMWYKTKIIKFPPKNNWRTNVDSPLRNMEFLI